MGVAGVERDPAGGKPLLKFGQISIRIAQPVDVIDAQTRERSLGNQPQKVSVRGLEYDGIFDAQPHQIGNRKKSTVVNALIDIAPISQLVVLLAYEALQM